MAHIPNKSKQAYVTYFDLASLLLSACVRNIATTSVDQLTTALVAERLFIRKIRMGILRQNKYHLAHESTNMRAIQPFSSTANFRASHMQPGHPESPLPEDILREQEKVSRLSRLVLLRSTTQPRYMTNNAQRLSLPVFNTQPTPTFPSQHRLLIHHCCNLPLHTTHKTALTTQHRLNEHKFSTIISPR